MLYIIHASDSVTKYVLSPLEKNDNIKLVSCGWSMEKWKIPLRFLFRKLNLPPPPPLHIANKHCTYPPH